MASRCTLVTSGHVASTTRRPRRRASWRTAGEMPWALKITVASSGTSSSSSTNIAPFWRSVSTTSRLWTISRRTYTGCGHTDSASSTLSMARSTPAQKPRGPARRISEMVDLIAPLASSEIVRHSGHGHMGLPSAVRVGRVAVGVVGQAVADVDRDRVGEEDRRADAAPHEEREARVDLPHPKIGPARAAGHLGVGHDPPEPQEVVTKHGREARPERRHRLRVTLVDGLEADLEGAVERPSERGAKGEERGPEAQAEELEVALRGLPFQIELRAVGALGRNHLRALGEGPLRVEGPRG